MPENSVKIILEAADKTQEAFNQLKASLGQVAKEIPSLSSLFSNLKTQVKDSMGQATQETQKFEEANKKSASSLSSFFSNLKNNWLEISAGIAAVYLTIKKVTDFSELGANSKQIKETFTSITQSYQIDGDALINKMRQVSTTFVDQTGVMTKAQRALVEGFNPDQIIKLTEAARVAARLMGVTVEEAFNRIMEAVITLQTRGLKAAFPIDLELVFRKYAESIGTVSDYLTDAGKKQAIYNEIIKQTEDRIKMLGGDLLPTAAEKIQAIKSSFDQFKSVAGEVTLEYLWEPGFAGADKFAGAIETVINKLKTLIATAKEVPGNIISFFTGGGKATPGAPTEPAISHEPSLPDFLVSHEPGGKSVGSVLIDYQKLKKDQFQVDTEYQGKYLALVNDRIGALEKERDKTLAEAKAKGMGTAEIEKYYLEAIERENVNILGITLQKDLATGAQAAIKSLDAIKQKMVEGKASIKDYQNALAAATEAMKKLVAPDITKSMADLQKKYEEGAKAISRDDPEFRKKIEALADSINEEMKKIRGPSTAELEADFREYNAKFSQQVEVLKSQLKSQFEAEPIKPKIDISGMETLKTAYNEVKREIESNPIKIKVDKSEVDTAGKGISNLRQQVEVPIEGEVQLYGIASSKKPLSDKIKDIISEFGGLSNVLSSLGAVIDLSVMTMQFNNLQTQLTQLQKIVPSMMRDLYLSNASNKNIDPTFVARVQGMQDMVTSQMFQVQMKMVMDLLQAFGGSYQTGTPYVPKTGLYILHKGEEVRTTNQVSMSMGAPVFNIYGSDPKKIADEIGKVLKYQYSGGLREAIKNIR